MSESDHDLACGSAVGDFTIVSRLSSGGFGTVYRARDGRDARGGEVAIKILHAHLAASPMTVARFERESRAAASLAHPGIVKIVAGGQLADGRPWFAMELLQGRELEEQLRASGPCSTRAARSRSGSAPGPPRTPPSASGSPSTIARPPPTRAPIPTSPSWSSSRRSSREAGGSPDPIDRVVSRG